MCVFDAEEIGKCTERGELLDLLRASAPAPAAPRVLDDPVCALDISWERLQILYDKGGEVYACRSSCALCVGACACACACACAGACA